jgi:hypothetical protein
VDKIAAIEVPLARRDEQKHFVTNATEFFLRNFSGEMVWIFWKRGPLAEGKRFHGGELKGVWRGYTPDPVCQSWILDPLTL